jgi:hypothetical protein
MTNFIIHHGKYSDTHHSSLAFLQLILVGLALSFQRVYRAGGRPQNVVSGNKKATPAADIYVSTVGDLRYFTNQYASAVKKRISIANTSGPHILLTLETAPMLFEILLV